MGALAGSRVHVRRRSLAVVIVGRTTSDCSTATAAVAAGRSPRPAEVGGGSRGRSIARRTRWWKKQNSEIFKTDKTPKITRSGGRLYAQTGYCRRGVRVIASAEKKKKNIFFENTDYVFIFFFQENGVRRRL